MMKGKYIVINFLFLIVVHCGCKTKSPAISPEDKLENQWIQDMDVVNFELDRLENLYLINSKGELKKYNSEGIFQYTFFDRSKGRIDYLDVRNPFKIMAFYRDFQQLSFLDNALGITSRTNLADLGIQDASAVCISLDNQLWLFDRLESRLKKMDQSGNLLLESNSLKAYLPNFNPVILREYNNYLIALNEDGAIYLFDNFGRYLNHVETSGLSDFHFYRGSVFYLEEGILHSWNCKNYFKDTVTIKSVNFRHVKDIHFTGKYVFVLDRGRVGRFLVD